MITCELMGGLGNQLFQIATTIYLAKENNDDFCFDIDTHNVHWQGNKASVYRGSIYSRLKNETFDVENTFNENGHEFKKIDYKTNMKIVGYFQSEKYFSKYRDNILDLFKPTDEINNYISEKYGNYLNKKTCSLHVRHGDYLTLAAHHQPLQMKYYQEAIKHFDSDTLFIVFSDDIEWCKSVFKGDNFIFIENESDIIDLYLMSMCKNNIIANSSFSWWGSWLNKNENKKVIAPSKWFGPANAHLKTDDIYTDKMIKI
jgi:hypothetical protein